MSANSADERPVVVLGAGPVGQTAALLLARWDVPVLLLDRRPERDVVGSKAICQQRDVLDVWSAVGAGRQIADEGVTWATARTFHRDVELFSSTFVDRGRSPFPPFVNLSQSRTEELLDAQIDADPRIEVRWDWELADLVQDDNDVTLFSASGKRVRARYVLACCGPRADDVRGMLGVTFDGQTFSDHFLICDIRVDLPGWETERRFWFDPEWNPGRQVLIHPCPDSTYRIDWQVPPEFDLEQAVASGERDALVRKIVGDRPYEVVWESLYRFHSRRVDRMRVGRVLLVGDLAHLVAPFGARGLNGGVLDAENAAWKTAFVVHGWAPDALLDSYDVERGQAADENLDVTSATMRFLVPHGEQEHRTRSEVLERALTDPEARTRVDSGRLAEPFWYSDSPLTTPDPTRPPTGRPLKGQTPPVAPGVLVPDLPVRDPARPAAGRLRELVREGLLAVLTEGVDAAEVEAAVKAVEPAPWRVVDAAAVDVEGLLPAALGTRPGEVWLIRPDGHVAAVVPWASGQDAVTAAARRALGHG